MTSIPLAKLKASTVSKGMMTVPKHDVYAGASEGPFRCDNCEYYVDPNTCTHEEIIKLRDGKVEAGACCDYFKRG